MCAASRSEPAPAALAPPSSRQLRVLFFMEHLGRYLRFFDSVIRELLERGHHVHLVFEREEEPPGPLELAWLKRMRRHPNFRSSQTLAWRHDPWHRVARPVRGALDYVYFLQLGERRLPFLVRRARRRAPATIRFLTRLPGAQRPGVLRAAGWILDKCDRAIPLSRRLQAFVREEDPDVVLVTPHLMPSSTDVHYAKSTLGMGLPTAICVASWDNLSSKQLLRIVPDVVTVWNDTQAREAIELHGIPPERVVSTGAQCFDHWFGWPPRPREAFCAHVGLDPAKPYVLYVGGSLFPASRTEAEFCLEWLQAIRASEEPALSGAGVLIRPHPHRNHEWQQVDFSGFDNVVLWPRLVRMPVEEGTRADYFDSIYHSAVVAGINTSAMIEAGIIGKAVHTIESPEFGESQGGVLHFRYLREVGGGLVQVSATLDEHVRRLGEVLAGCDTEGEEAARRFTEIFVRPQGVQVPSTPVFVDAVEQLAARGSQGAPAEPGWLVLLRPLLSLWRVSFFLLRVRLKLALELRRLGGRA